MTAALAPYWTHKERLLTKHNDICGICYKPIDLRLVRPNPGSFTIDHIHPRSKGGCDHVENLRPAHLGCNSRRGDRVTSWPTCRACHPITKAQPAADNSNAGTWFGITLVMVILAVIIGWVVYVAVANSHPAKCDPVFTDTCVTATDPAGQVSYDTWVHEYKGMDTLAAKKKHDDAQR